MKTLRVRLESPPDPARAEPWVLVDDHGRTLASGIDTPQRWPPADRRIAVLAADAVRMLALQLPPLPASRVAAAAAFALEDRLATPLDDAIVAVGPRRDGEPVVAIVAGRALAVALAAAQPRFDRAIVEAQLPADLQGWGWYESRAGGFVRAGDGSAFAVSVAADPALPPELLTALRQAARAGTAPEQVVASRPADAGLLAAWAREGGVPFVAGEPWQWESVPAAAFAAAIDVLAPARAARTASRQRESSMLPTALALVALAAGLHLAATAGTWGWRKIELARSERALDTIARELGASAPAGIARVHADARHRSGRAAPSDALPLLARAAPALAALPPGALRTATYGQGAWTIELAKVDEAALAALRDRTSSAGLAVVHAPTASGVRARIGVAP
jgi:hypothetical protein